MRMHDAPHANTMLTLANEDRCKPATTRRNAGASTRTVMLPRKCSAKASAEAKLAALGLTAEEIAAL